MKKKIINGILMVALIFAATTSFVSCKDNVDDELIPVYEQLAKVKSDLEARVASIESQLNNLAGQVEANSKAIKDLQTKLDTELADIKNQLKDINNQIATLSASVDAIQKDLDGVKARLDGIDAEILRLQGEIENLKAQINNLITDIKINHTVNEVVGSIQLPGYNMLALAPFYGENLTGIISFPNNVKGALVDPNGVELTANEVAGAGTKALTIRDEGYITETTGNAGWMFFTVNTPDPAAFNIDEYELKVQNSVGYEAPITFSNVKKSSYQIQWGIYHSQYIDSDPDLNQDPTFYQAQAHIAPKDLESAKFNLSKFLDFKELSAQYKEAVNNVKEAAGKKAKAVALVQSVTDMVRSFFSGKMSGNNTDIKNPSWSAQKLVLQKTVDGITVEKGSAEYDLVVTAVTPLSYNSFWYLETASKVADLTRVENLVYKVANKIKNVIPNIQLGKITIQLQKPTVGDGANGYIVVRSDDGTALAPTITGEATIELEADLFDPLWDAIQEGLTDIDLSNMIQGLDKINGMPKEVDKFAARVNSYIEKMANAYVTSLNNHCLTQAIAPWILFNTTNGIERLTYGTKVTPGNMQIMMTSPTEELLVPSYAKYIAVENEEGKIIQSDVLPGKTQQYTLDMNKPGKYFVILSSMDYWGFVINKKYLVEVVAPAA
jgi:archaellum component FlaC